MGWADMDRRPRRRIRAEATTPNGQARHGGQRRRDPWRQPAQGPSRHWCVVLHYVTYYMLTALPVAVLRGLAGAAPPRRRWCSIVYDGVAAVRGVCMGLVAAGGRVLDECLMSSGVRTSLLPRASASAAQPSLLLSGGRESMAHGKGAEQRPGSGWPWMDIGRHKIRAAS